MEGGGEEPGGPGWAGPGEGHFQPHSTTDVYTTQSQQQAFPSTSQQGVVTSFADSQLQAVLAHSSFPQVYQPTAGPSSEYDRGLSPGMEYPGSTSGEGSLQQFRLQPAEGGAQIIRVQTINDGSGNQQPLVTVLLSNNALANNPQVAHHLEQMMPVSMAAMSSMQQQASQSMSLTTLAAAASLPSSGLGMEPSVSGLGGTLGVVREVSHLEVADSVEHVVSHSQQDSLLQVVTSLPQLHQPESTTSEATPVGHSESEHHGGQHSMSLTLNPKIEVYSSEPDTTQEELGQPYGQQLQHHRHHAYNEPHSSSHQGHDLDLGHSSSLDAGMGHVVDGNAVASTSGVTMATVNVSQPAMDPSIDTSGIIAHTPGGADSDLEMLVSGQHVLQIEPTTLHQHQHQHHQLQPSCSQDEMQHDVSHQEVTQHDVTPQDVIHNVTQQVEVRKSLRLATLDSASIPARFQPETVYNTTELWCEDCKTVYPTECLKHRLQPLYDKVVLSRAWASLPASLQIFRLGETPELGLFAKKTVPNRTQFGPLIAELVPTQEQVTANRFLLQLDRPTGETYFVEAADENKCNWMMFVRPALNWGEQNLVAYQYNSDIYYVTIKTIEPKQELKVWYAAHYAQRLGAVLLEPQDTSSLSDRWPCYECNERFRTSALLQKHLSVHDDNPNAGAFDDYDDDDNDPTVTSYERGKRAAAIAGPADKKFIKKEIGIPDENQANVSQNWKKKKTSIYLNKYKKYHQETIKKSIKSLYKKKGKDCGGQGWVCTHCDLTFDNSSLLNLHTLTHAAEDIGLQEIQKLCGEADDPSADGAYGLLAVPGVSLSCPVCHEQFPDKSALIVHASEHGKIKKRSLLGLSSFNPNKPHKCSKCWKAFTTKERLTKHMLCHGDQESKPMQCGYCKKRFMNNSALACHLKTHSDKKYYECPLCRECFDQVTVMKSHVVTHLVNGVYTCPECHKTFSKYSIIRKHMRAFHSEKKYPCPDCDKILPRPDKLKLHMLRHSAHREFMCETCGRQFKRKDKLKEHNKRMHGPEHDHKARQKSVPGQKKFTPKVSPNDYHRFIYKCHTCLLGFKRRGMLVNHLAKRHPDMRPEHVPELNLPILRTQRDYYCQYCEKVYKSSSKRKAHIVKNHPGSDLPISSRKGTAYVDVPGLPNPTYSQMVGSVTTVPHQCEFCHKQYASKAKLLQHQRKKHSDMVPPARRPVNVTRVLTTVAIAQKHQPQQLILSTTTPSGEQQERYITVETAPDEQQSVTVTANTDNQADLLTQAMSELTQTLTLDYRGQVGAEYEAVTTQRIMPGSTIEFNHLGQMQATHYQVVPSVSQPSVVSQQPLSPSQQLVTAVATSQVTAQPMVVTAAQIPVEQQQLVITSESEPQTVATPVSLNGSTVSYIPRVWTTVPTTNYQ